MRPIPKRLLIHSATAVTEGKADIWNEKSAASETQLSLIRVEPSSDLTVSKQNEQVKLSAILIFDCKNSKPAGFEFDHVKHIVFEGQKYNIEGIGKFYDERKLHHYEVELCL